MSEGSPPDRIQRRWWFRPLIIAAAILILVAVVALLPRYRLQLVTVDQTHRWPDAQAPPKRQIVWQPATPLSPMDDAPPISQSRIRPQITDHGNVLYFTARSEGDHYDIMRSERIDGQWTPPQGVDELNSRGNEIGPIVRADGRVLYLYSDRDGGFGGMDLYVSHRQGDRWTKPKNLGPAINGPAHEYDPAISPDGSRLYFSSNRSESMHTRMAGDDYDPKSDHWGTTLRTDLGNRTFDLYVSRLDESTKRWTHASPLSSLNTPQYNEGSPFVSADGAFLVFVSDRPQRRGEPQNYDIYRARIDGQPLSAENLGPGVNSSANEIEPALAGAGFQILFSRSIDSDATRYALFQSTAQEVFQKREWESSRWQSFSGSIGSLFRTFVDRFWWIVLALALLAMLIWLIRQWTLRRVAIPGFLLSALVIHFLLVTSSFYVFFQEEISSRIRKMFDEETVVASEVLFPATAETVDDQPNFDQVADLKMPESVQPTEVTRQSTETAQADVQPIELAMPEMPANLTGDLPADAVVATILVPVKSVEPSQQLSRRSPQSALASPDQVTLEKTVAVDPTQAEPIDPIQVEVAMQTIDVAEPVVEPIEATADQRESLSPAEESELLPELMTTRIESAAISIERADASKLPTEKTEATIPTETIIATELPSRPRPQPKSVDVPLLRETAAPAIAEPEPIEMIAENRTAPPPLSEDSSPQQLVISDASQALASNRSPADAPLQRARHSPRQADQPSESLRIIVPAGKGESVEDQPPPKLASVDVDRQSLGELVIPLDSPTSTQAMSEWESAGDNPTSDLPTELPATTAAIPVSLQNNLPRRRSLKASDAYADSNVNLRSLLQRRKLDGAMKSQIIKQFGGNDQTLAAIREGLTWIEQHQHSDGHWGLHDFHDNCKGHKRCSGNGGSKSDSAGTGLALLPFLGDGNTHRQGPHKDLVARGITWLVAHQKPDGDLFTGGQDIAWMYSHGIATIALCECYGMSGDAALRGPAQRAIDFIVAAQDAKTGGWRYRPRDGADTSVVGWQVMALKSGQMAELNVPQKTLQEAERWLQSVAGKGGRKGQFAYQGGRYNPAMTAEALLCLEYLGAEREEDQLCQGADFLLANTPKKNRESSYFWYYGTQAMFHLQGEHWQKWNSELHPLLIETQQKEGPTSGTWDARDQWEKSGGRIYSTSLRLLMLEVYYRHLPLYRVIE